VNTVTPRTTRAVCLVRRPDGAPLPTDFAVEDRPLPLLREGQLLVRNLYMSVDPSMRGRLESTEKHYTHNFTPGSPLDGRALGVVEDSRWTRRTPTAPGASTPGSPRCPPGWDCSARPGSPPTWA
jgi:NADPH-dependent curcumin reductase CurA